MNREEILLKIVPLLRCYLDGDIVYENDSLDFWDEQAERLELCVDIEIEFNIIISAEETKNWKFVKDVIDSIEKEI